MGFGFFPSLLGEVSEQCNRRHLQEILLFLCSSSNFRLIFTISNKFIFANAFHFRFALSFSVVYCYHCYFCNDYDHTVAWAEKATETQLLSNSINLVWFHSLIYGALKSFLHLSLFKRSLFHKLQSSVCFFNSYCVEVSNRIYAPHLTANH